MTNMLKSHILSGRILLYVASEVSNLQYVSSNDFPPDKFFHFCARRLSLTNPSLRVHFLRTEIG